MTRTLGSLRKSVLILKSLSFRDQDNWVAEYPTETELYILNRVIKDLTEWHKYTVEMVCRPNNNLDKEIVNHMLDEAAEVYLYLQQAKDRFKHLKSKHLVPIWLTQIINRLKLILDRFS